MTKNIITATQFEQAPRQAVRDGFGQGLLAAAQDNPQVVAVAADLKDSIRMNTFADNFPERFFEVGVAEQNLVGVAAGLAKEGLVAFAGSYAAFSPGRTHDQIRVSVCYSNRNVKIVGGHAGLTVGPDGATHQALEDIAMMRVLPNMTVLVPSDYQTAMELTKQAAKLNTPVYIRLSRAKSRSLVTKTSAVKIGSAITMLKGDDLAIVATGMMIDRALQLAWQLGKQGVSARVLNLHTIKPLDKSAILQAAQETGRIMTIEEHQQAGGMGSAVAEFLAQNHSVPMQLVAVEDKFGKSGQPEELLDAYGFKLEDLVLRAKQLLAQ